MSYGNTNNSSSSAGNNELYFPTNADARRRLGRMERAYSLNDPYGPLNIRPVVSNGAIASFNPISVTYCPSTEKVYCGNSAKFIHVLNPKKTGSIEASSLVLLAESTANSNINTSYDSEFIKGADSAHGSMSKAYILLSDSEFSGTVEIKFSIKNYSDNSPYYYGYKVTKNNTSSVLFLSGVVAEGCYNENIDGSLTSRTPSTLEDLNSYTSYVVTTEISKGDSLELWVGGAMLNCASTGASSLLVTDTKIFDGFKVRALHEDSLEKSIVWGGSDNYLRKDYVGNFTSHENRHYVDGAYSPINDKIYYAFNSKEGYETLSGGFGIAKIDPHTHNIETEIGLYNFSPAEGTIYTDANLSQMRSMLPLPKKLIYCPTNNKIYVLHGDPVKSWVTVVNPLTDKISGSFTHSSLRDASDMEYSSINDKIYVTNKAGYSISVINPQIISAFSVLPFVYDEWTKLLLHLDSDFCFVILSESSTTGGAVSMMGMSRILKDYVIGTLTKTKDIDYKTNFLSELNTKLDEETLSPDDDYSTRWKEKDFNKTQHNRVHTIFDGNSCQKIPYRPEWGSCDSEFTIELWVNPDKDFFQARNQQANGEYVIEKYSPRRSAPQAGDPSTMLLFSIGNVHNSTHLCPDCKTGEAALALSLNTGRSYDDEARGGLTLHWGSGSKTYAARHEARYDKKRDHASTEDEPNHLHPHKPFGGGVIFGEWNHIALVKRPGPRLFGTAWSGEVEWDIFVNGHLFVTEGPAGGGGPVNTSVVPNFLMTRGYDDSRDDTSNNYGDAEDRTLYIGGTAGSVKFRRIKEIDFEHNDILLEDNDFLPAAASDEHVNIYSNSYTYPGGVNRSTKYYLGDETQMGSRWPRRKLYLNKNDAISPADMPGIDLEHLKPYIQKKEFKYSSRGEECYRSYQQHGKAGDAMWSFYDCSSPSDYEETMVPKGGPPTETISVFNHTITQEGAVSINVKLKSCTDLDQKLEDTTLEIYKNNKLFQTVLLDNRFDGEPINIWNASQLPSCVGIDINDSPIKIDCREGDVVFGIMYRGVALGRIVVETVLEESPSKYDDLFLTYTPSQVGHGHLGTGHVDNLLSWPRWLKKNWMHYSGLMNGFRISNISRYDKEFRPLRFDDFTEDEHTVLLVDGGGKAKAKNDIIRYRPASNFGAVSVARTDKLVLDTSNPSPGSIWPKTYQRKVHDPSGAPSWVEEFDKKEPGASYRLPYGFRRGTLLTIDDPGELIGAEGKGFSITAEINWLKYDSTDSDINYGINQKIEIARWASVRPADWSYSAANYVFDVIKTGQAKLRFQYWVWRDEISDITDIKVCWMEANLNQEDLGNNKWNKFSVVRNEDATSISLYHNDLLLKTETTIFSGPDDIGYPKDGWNTGDPIKPEHWVPASWASINIHGEAWDRERRGIFSIGEDNKCDFALGQYEIISDGKQVFALDPNIASHHNQLGSVYSDLDELSLYEMENVEIMSLGKPGDPDDPSTGWTKIDPLMDDSFLWLGATPRKDYVIETAGSLFVDVGSPYSYDPLTTLGQNHQTANDSRFYNVSASVEHGYAFFKGNNTTLPSPAANQKLSYDLRYISSGSYIKHLPKLGHAASWDPEWRAAPRLPPPIYGFDPDVSSLGNKNFVIECSIMPTKLPVSDGDTGTTIDTEMGILCFNYDDLDSSSVDWSDCPDYVIDANGNTRSQCENSPIDERTSWQSSSSNEGTVGWQLRIKSDGKVDFKFGSQDRNTIPGNLDYYYDGEPRTLTSTSSLKYNKWYLLTVSRVGENVFLYINGSKEASINIGQETILEHPINVGVSKYEKMGLLIGKSYDGGVTNSSSTPSYFTGLMNEVRVRPSINNAHHTPYYGAPGSTLAFQENYVYKPFIDQSLAYHSPDDGKLYFDSVDYLHLNFNDFVRNRAPRGGGEFGLGSTKTGNFIGSDNLWTKSNYITFDVEREGYVKIRNNDEEGVAELGSDGYIKVGGSSQLNLGANFVVEGWFLSNENENLISKTNANCDGWDLIFMNHGLSFSILQKCAEIKNINGGYPQDSRGRWNHFAIQLEDAQKISLMLNGHCVASGVLSLIEYGHMNKDPNAGIEVGRNSRSGTLFVDNIRATKEAVYKNYKKPVVISGRPELLREPDVYHLHSKGIDYEKSKITDHSLKLKSNYAEGNAININVDSVVDFDSTEDFTIELFFRTDDINDLSLGTSFLIERGSEWGASSDQGYYIGLETDQAAPGIKRSRLVARAGGVVLKAKENDSRSYEYIIEGVEGLAVHEGWAHCSGDSPSALYFYNIDDFISGSYEVGFNHVEDDYIIQKYKHVMLCRHTYAGIPYLSLFVDKRLVASNFEISSASNSTTFIDSSDSAHTITPSGDVHHSCEKSRVDNIEAHDSGVSTSIYFDGADDWLAVTDDESLRLGTGDFTIEFWLYWSSAANWQTVMSKGYIDSDGWVIQSDQDNTKLKLYLGGSTGSSAGGLMESTGAAVGTWAHYAFVRNGTSLKIYRDGVETGSSTGTIDLASSDPLNIGATDWGSPGSHEYGGYIDEIRISKGPEGGARYAGAFTPQDAPFEPDGSTVLLIHSDDKPAHTYALTALGDNVDVSSWPITIGGDGTPSDSYFSGNINLIKIERGTNPSLSTSYVDDWLKDRLKALSAARIQSGSSILENQYGGIDGFHWATGAKLYNQTIYYRQEFGGSSGHASSSYSSHDVSHLYYPSMDSWYVQGNTFRDSRMTNLPMPGGTELFLDFSTQFIDGNTLVSPANYNPQFPVHWSDTLKGPVAYFRSLGDGYIADTQDSVFKGMYTPPTNLSAIYFGKISQATINKNHVSTVDYDDGLLAYDYKNNWNYMNEDFVMSAWIKPEDITNSPTIFYRGSRGQTMHLRIGPGQDSTDDTTGQLLFEYRTDQEMPWILSDGTTVDKPGEYSLRSKDDVIKQNEWQHIAIAKEKVTLQSAAVSEEAEPECDGQVRTFQYYNQPACCAYSRCVPTNPSDEPGFQDGLIKRENQRTPTGQTNPFISECDIEQLPSPPSAVFGEPFSTDHYTGCGNVGLLSDRCDPYLIHRFHGKEGTVDIVVAHRYCGFPTSSTAPSPGTEVIHELWINRAGQPSVHIGPDGHVDTQRGTGSGLGSSGVEGSAGCVLSNSELIAAEGEGQIVFSNIEMKGGDTIRLYSNLVDHFMYESVVTETWVCPTLSFRYYNEPEDCQYWGESMSLYRCAEQSGCPPMGCPPCTSCWQSNHGLASDDHRAGGWTFGLSTLVEGSCPQKPCIEAQGGGITTTVGDPALIHKVQKSGAIIIKAVVTNCEIIEYFPDGGSVLGGSPDWNSPATEARRAGTGTGMVFRSGPATQVYLTKAEDIPEDWHETWQEHAIWERSQLPPLTPHTADRGYRGGWLPGNTVFGFEMPMKWLGCDQTHQRKEHGNNTAGIWTSKPIEVEKGDIIMGGGRGWGSELTTKVMWEWEITEYAEEPPPMPPTAPTALQGAKWTMYLNGQAVEAIDDSGGTGLQRWPMMDFAGNGAETLHIGKRPNQSGVTGNACPNHADLGSGGTAWPNDLGWSVSPPYVGQDGTAVIYWIWGCGGTSSLSTCYNDGDQHINSHDLHATTPYTMRSLTAAFNGGTQWYSQATFEGGGIATLSCPDADAHIPVLEFNLSSGLGVGDISITTPGMSLRKLLLNHSNDSFTASTTTWECWFNTQSADLQYLVCLNTDQQYYGLSITPGTGEIHFGGHPNHIAVLSATPEGGVELNHWNHVAVTIGASQLSIFFNGERVAHTNSFIPPPDLGWGTMTIGSQHYIGNDVVGSGWRYHFIGWMTDIIYTAGEKYRIGELPSIAGLGNFTGYMSEFLIATAPFRGAGYGMGKLSGKSTAELVNQYETIFEKGAGVIYPNDIKFLLNFNDFEDHSMDVERGKPEPSENTVLLLPFDKDEQDKSGQGSGRPQEIITTNIETLCLQHKKYEVTSEIVWWRNHAIKGRVWVGDYIVHGDLSIAPDGQGNNVVNFPGNRSSYLELQDRKGTPQVIKAGSTGLKGECAAFVPGGPLPINCPNSENYSLEFWFRTEGLDTLGNQYYNKNMIVPLMGGEKLDSRGNISTYFYVCLEVVPDGYGGIWQGPRGRVVISKRDEWDIGRHSVASNRPADLISSIRLSPRPPGSPRALEEYNLHLDQLQNSDLLHVYVCRKDDIWFLYVDGEYQDHIREGAPRSPTDTKESAGDISFDTWTVGGVTNIPEHDIFKTGIFRGRIDMIRELSGGVPYNPIEYKGELGVSGNFGPVLPDLRVVTDLTTLPDFPQKVAGENYWDRKLEEIHCPTVDPPPPPPPPPPCFLAGTKISMKDGTEKNIENVLVEDEVKSFNSDTGEITNSVVVGATEHPHTEGYYIINNDLKVTGNHPMWANDEWQDVQELIVGYELLHLDGSKVAIESIEKINETVTTYNIDVEDIDTYFANSYVSHNKDPVGSGACCDSRNIAGTFCYDNVPPEQCVDRSSYFGDGTTCATHGQWCGGGIGAIGACCYKYLSPYYPLGSEKVYRTPDEGYLYGAGSRATVGTKGINPNDQGMADPGLWAPAVVEHLCGEYTELACYNLGMGNLGSTWHGGGSICNDQNPGTYSGGDCTSAFIDPIYRKYADYNSNARSGGWLEPIAEPTPTTESVYWNPCASSKVAAFRPACCDETPPCYSFAPGAPCQCSNEAYSLYPAIGSYANVGAKPMVGTKVAISERLQNQIASQGNTIDGYYVAFCPNCVAPVYNKRANGDTCCADPNILYFFPPMCTFCDSSKARCAVDGCPSDQIVCGMDVFMCPDGSGVGRDSNNNCNFFPCPTQATSFCTVQLFPFEPEDQGAIEYWTNEKDEDPTLSWDRTVDTMFSGFWKILGDLNRHLFPSVGCPIIDPADKYIGIGSGVWDGTCYSTLEDSSGWDFGQDDFTVEFWYKKSNRGVSSNTGPFNTNGTCVVGRQGHGFSSNSLGWSTELSYVKQDLATVFMYYRLKRRLDNHVDSVGALGAIYTPPSRWDSGLIKLPWENSIIELDSPEMRFSFCIDNGYVKPFDNTSVLEAMGVTTLEDCFSVWSTVPAGGPHYCGCDNRSTADRILTASCWAYMQKYGKPHPGGGCDPPYFDSSYSATNPPAGDWEMMGWCPNCGTSDPDVPWGNNWRTNACAVSTLWPWGTDGRYYYTPGRPDVYGNVNPVVPNAGTYINWTPDMPDYVTADTVEWEGSKYQQDQSLCCPTGGSGPTGQWWGMGEGAFIVNTGISGFTGVNRIAGEWTQSPTYLTSNTSTIAGTNGKIHVMFTLSWGSPKNDVWEHYAIVRSGQTFRTFKNGKIIDEISGDQPVLRYDEDLGDTLKAGSYGDEKFNIKTPENNPLLSIAADTKFINSDWLLQGRIDELRISKGIARYTEEFELGGGAVEGAVESTISTTQKTAAITYCPIDDMLYAFTANTGETYQINPRSNAITDTVTFSDSNLELVKESYFCPINNTILISSFDGLYRLYSFLPKGMRINQTFNVQGEGRFTYAGTTNKIYYACENYIYEIGD